MLPAPLKPGEKRRRKADRREENRHGHVGDEDQVGRRLTAGERQAGSNYPT